MEWLVAQQIRRGRWPSLRLLYVTNFMPPFYEICWELAKTEFVLLQIIDQGNNEIKAT